MLWWYSCHDSIMRLTNTEATCAFKTKKNEVGSCRDVCSPCRTVLRNNPSTKCYDVCLQSLLLFTQRI